VLPSLVLRLEQTMEPGLSHVREQSRITHLMFFAGDFGAGVNRLYGRNRRYSTVAVVPRSMPHGRSRLRERGACGHTGEPLGKPRMSLAPAEVAVPRLESKRAAQVYLHQVEPALHPGMIDFRLPTADQPESP
jgi:hypothetical protein